MLLSLYLGSVAFATASFIVLILAMKKHGIMPLSRTARDYMSDLLTGLFYSLTPGVNLVVIGAALILLVMPKFFGESMGRYKAEKGLK